MLVAAGLAAGSGPRDVSAPLAALPLVRIEAAVSDDLQEIRGTIQVLGAAGVRLVDPLARWPEPPDDRQRLRTYPGRSERGRVRFVQVGPDEWSFTTWLPRRYDDLGWWRNKSLYANGAWYPQPMIGDDLVVATWTVDVTVPAGALGVVGTSVAPGEVRWVGHGERASLAVVRRATVTPVRTPGVELTLVTRGPPRRSWMKRPGSLLSAARPAGETLAAAVVEAPLRRRLARPGSGLTYVSDRTWRLTPGLRRYHDRAVTRALLASSIRNPDPHARAVAAEVFSRQAPTARDLLRRFRWNPVVDAVLNDRTLPFWGDVLGPGAEGDPVQDDLLEVWGTTPSARELADEVGRASTDDGRAFATALARGRSVAQAWEEAGLAPATEPEPAKAGDGWVATWAAWIEQVNPTAGWVAGSASLWVRDRTDPRHVGSASISVDQRSLPSIAVGYTHLRGRPQDGLRRPHRLSVWFEPAWSNRRFTLTDRPVLTLGGGASWTWDSRVSELFPLEGGRIRLAGSGGVAPAEGTRWATASASTAGLLSPHPRLTLAGRAYAGWATGTTTERLLWLGGPGAGSGLAPRTAYGTRLAVAEGELRVAPIRHASLPLGGWAWLAEIQVTSGLEAATLRADDGEAGALGWTVGGAVVVELLGARPGLAGVTVSRPITTWGLSGRPSDPPQVTLRLGQSF